MSCMRRGGPQPADDGVVRFEDCAELRHVTEISALVMDRLRLEILTSLSCFVERAEAFGY